MKCGLGDSQGFERVVSQFSGTGTRRDVIPSWLVGGEDGGTSVIHLGKRVYLDNYSLATVNCRDYEIEGMENWVIRYTHGVGGHFDLNEIAANELLYRSRHTLPVNVVYSSRPDPASLSSWMYFIMDVRSHRLFLGPGKDPSVRRTKFTRLPFRQLSTAIQAVTDWSLLLRRYSDILQSAESVFHRSKVNNMSDEPVLTLVMATPPSLFCCGYTRHENVVEVLKFVAHVIHRDMNESIIILDDYTFIDVEEFLRRAFFLDSYSPEPVHSEPRVYRFRTLQDVLGDEFEGYDREYIRSMFQAFVELVKFEWDQPEPNPGAIPSIVDLIEQPLILK
jgi:hypothetical protein